MDIPQEEVGGQVLLDQNWPSHGEIQFQNVTLRYMPSLPAALHDVSFTISGGTQVSALFFHLLHIVFRLTVSDNL
jgi:ATP-binding cassette, subfamily C (CFTR/MRP), member 10